MVWAGEPFAHYVEFSTGLPTGAVSLILVGNDGSQIHAETLTPDTGAVGIRLEVDGSLNTCALPIMESRVLTWSYDTATASVSGRIGYRVDRPIPFPATCDGVRNKLGVEVHEISDSEIDLTMAYSDLLSATDASLVEAVAEAGNRSTLLMTSAIEAIAAIALLPSLQLRAAQKESSGTNQFSRFSNIDWKMLEDSLNGHVLKALAAVDATVDSSGTSYFVFGTAPRETDAITG